MAKSLQRINGWRSMQPDSHYDIRSEIPAMKSQLWRLAYGGLISMAKTESQYRRP
jgi:hypothetical protein